MKKWGLYSNECGNLLIYFLTEVISTNFLVSYNGLLLVTEAYNIHKPNEYTSLLNILCLISTCPVLKPLNNNGLIYNSVPLNELTTILLEIFSICFASLKSAILYI